ncbi:CBS domain-containing protein [uncultured Dokdonia sp.]|uniref:CBS domain-containing protein n=1 Tax=uncultured Dokdonia sp. TaxID=575653 RepID=UPI002639390E|nr:CBS domain-containing protein [uncultured Dokdonia sp.]
MSITDFIINDIKPVAETASIGEVQTIFSQTTHSHVPIHRGSVYVGCLAENDTHCYDSNCKISDYTHAYEHFFVRYETNWLDILETFAQNSANIMPVLDENNSYIGYYELADVMNFFNNTPFISEPGSVVIIEKGIQDYSFSEISQIVESNDGKIWGGFISKIENDVAQISIKIGRSNFNDILAAFRRYSYNVISSHQEDTFIKDLRERSQYLEKYLNI